MPDDHWAVIYDADCGFCKWLLAGVLRWDRAARLRPLALQRPEAGDLVADLTPAERMASWHLISPPACGTPAARPWLPCSRCCRGAGCLQQPSPGSRR